ncbi:MAG: cytochrome c class [Chitinophagaceae bacterium]|nr:cytochrome c class [Chitinophagaceae bacterium]
MKRLLIVTVALTMLASCGNNDGTKGGEKKADTVAKAETKDLSENPDYQKGLAIEAASDCATCHKIDEKVQGPAYQDIAKKYAGLPDTIVTHLAKKIISGGTGVWGEILMIPHPQLSQADAEAAVKYILLLKK